MTDRDLSAPVRDSRPTVGTPPSAQLLGWSGSGLLQDLQDQSYDPHPPPYDKENDVVDVDYLVTNLCKQNCAGKKGPVLVELVELPSWARDSLALVILGKAGFKLSKYGALQGWVAVNELGELANKLGRIAVLGDEE
jgi:hypothetical protein